MEYELYYWPIQGRGELARLIFEDTGTPYDDIARRRGGIALMEKILTHGAPGLLPFAPPFLRVLASGSPLWMAQSALIASYLGERLGLAPDDEQGRYTARTIVLTIADLVDEIHDTHHPIATDKLYGEQKPQAKLRAEAFRTRRLPKFLGYLERTLAYTGTGLLVGREVTYADLAAFQIVEGLTFAFPNTFAKLSKKTPHLVDLHARIAKRPRLAAYLASERRIPFGEHDVFRRYPELDDAPKPTKPKTKR